MYISSTSNAMKYSLFLLLLMKLNLVALYDLGFSVIDASIIPDGKQYVMFLENETRYPVERTFV